MKALVLLAALFLLTGAARVVDPYGNTVTVYETPCVSAKVIAQIPRFNALLAQVGGRPRTADSFMAADLVFEGKQYAACWTVVGADVVVIDDSGQDTSIFGVPMQYFVDVPKL